MLVCSKMWHEQFALQFTKIMINTNLMLKTILFKMIIQSRNGFFRDFDAENKCHANFELPIRVFTLLILGMKKQLQ